MSWRRDPAGAFGTALAAHLAAAGMTQAEVARRAGVHVSYISRLLSGDRMPEREVATAIADALDLSPVHRAALLMACGFLPDDAPVSYTHLTLPTKA